jgi:hypothetical protein
MLSQGEQIWLHPAATPCTPRIEHAFATTGGSAMLRDGRVLIGYSGGRASPHELRAGESTIYQRVSADRGSSWGEERAVIHHPECKAVTPTYLRAGDGTLWVFYLGFYKSAWKDGNPDWTETRSDVWCARSEDDGETWQDPRIVFRGYSGATNGGIETASGHLVFPFSYDVDKPGRLVSACLVSADRGQTWELGKHVDLGGNGDHAGAMEPAVVELRDGRVWMLIRTTMGRFWQAYSTDSGLHWTGLGPSAIQSPSAPCYLTRLASGRLLLVWNDTMARTKKRDTLSAALSEDDGATWTDPLECARAGQVSYPYALEIAPGEILVSCQHVLADAWKAVTPVLFRIGEEVILRGRPAA